MEGGGGCRRRGGGGMRPTCGQDSPADLSPVINRQQDVAGVVSLVFQLRGEKRRLFSHVKGK